MAASNFGGFSWTEEKSSIILEIMTHLVISKKLDVLADGVMPQTRRMRWKISSGDSSWPPQEQMTGDSSSHAAPPQAPTCVNWDDDMDDFMPPNHGLQHMMFLPLYTNLEPEKRERERQKVHQVMLHHLKH